MAILAAGDWGINIKNWIVQQGSAVAIAALVIVIIPMIAKKQWSNLMGTVVFGGIAIFVINSPDMLKDLGKIIYEIVFK